MTETPDFSGVAASYSKGRPGYPRQLFDWLASTVTRHEVAWDAATGNGQAALDLAPHFQRVIATDRSATQIAHARSHPRIEYRVARVESTDLEPHSVDLATVAAAIHWFDLPAFYEEVRRVVRPGGVLVAWTYHVAEVEPPFEEIFHPFYWDVVRPYFADGARLVDDKYASLELPGLELEAPRFTMSARWTYSDVLRFVSTWSGVQSYIEKTGKNPLEDLAPRVERIFGSRDAVREVRWPLFLRASRL